MRRCARPALIVLIGALVVLSGVACSGDPAPTSTPTPPLPVTQTPAPDGVPIEHIREANLAAVSLVGPQRLLYADMTGDGVEEAVIFVESGGTQGDLGIAVVHVLDGHPAILGFVDAGGRVDVTVPEVGGGVIVSRQGIWQPGDPECCPSNLREQYYQWNGTTFVVTVDQVVENPRR